MLDAAAAPPQDLTLALAALGVAEDTEVEAATAAGSKKRGGIMGRLKKAAPGDIRGAVEGTVDPAAATSRVQDAKASPPALYRIRLNYPVEIFGEAP